jgi:hypothetical protein
MTPERPLAAPREPVLRECTGGRAEAVTELREDDRDPGVLLLAAVAARAEEEDVAARVPPREHLSAMGVDLGASPSRVREDDARASGESGADVGASGCSGLRHG